MNNSNNSFQRDWNEIDPRLLEEDNLEASIARQSDANAGESKHSLPPVEEDYFTYPTAGLKQSEDYYDFSDGVSSNTTVPSIEEDYFKISAPNYTLVPEDFFEPTDDQLRTLEYYPDQDDTQIRPIETHAIDDTTQIVPASFIAESIESARELAEELVEGIGEVAKVAEQVYEARFQTDASLASRVWELQARLAEKESYEGRESDQTELNVLAREEQMRQRVRAIADTTVRELNSDDWSVELLIVGLLGAKRMQEMPYFMSELSRYKHDVFATCADALAHYIRYGIEHGDGTERADREFYEFMMQIASFYVDLVPGVGDVKGVTEAIIGQDLITGKDLAWWERVLSAVPLLPNVWKTRHLDEVGNLRHLDEASDVVRAGDKLIDAVRAADKIGDVAKINKMVDPDTITSILEPLRDEAVRLTNRLVEVEAALGRIIDHRKLPREFGEIADAVFKSHVKHAQDLGQLPKRLQTASTALRVSGTKLERAVDVWDPVTGVGWDLTTFKYAARHDRYIGEAMRDGTIIKQTIMLLYNRK